MTTMAISMKRPLIQEMIFSYTKFWNSNCKTCVHFQKYKHPLQELHYKNSAIGECVKMKRMIYNEEKPVCKLLLYESKYEKN
jgi:hypothetical protein